MIRSNSKKAIENIRSYIMENSNFDNYGIEHPNTFTETAKLIMHIFADEYLHYRKGIINHYKMFEEWASGLPSVLDTCYYYNRSAVADVAMILEETEAEASKYSEAEAEKLLTWLIYREISKACHYCVK